MKEAMRPMQPIKNCFQGRRIFSWMAFILVVTVAWGVVAAETPHGSEPVARSGPPVNPLTATNAEVHAPAKAAPSAHTVPVNPLSPAVPAAPAAQTQTNRNGDISESLQSSRQMLETTNLLQESVAVQREDEQKRLQLKLEIARRQWLAKQYSEAEPNLIGIMESNATEDMKRIALIELALVAHEQNDLPKAQQIYAQYLSRWPQDPNGPEILLRQGLIYRQMGLNNLAISKFYTVMTSSLVLKTDRIDYYQRLVLQAQTEIAETYYLQAKYESAVESFGRLLKSDSPVLNRPQIQFKLIRSLARLERNTDVIAQAEDFITRYPGAVELPEVRFTMAMAMKQLGRNGDAMQQVLVLLKTQQGVAKDHPETLAYWQQRTGNEIANQLYKERDYLKALDIYLAMVVLEKTPDWQFPVLYQVGIIFERLEQPAKAVDYYSQIITREKEVATNAAPSLKTVVDMARWRKDFLNWQIKMETNNRDLKKAVTQQAFIATDGAPTTSTNP